MIVSFIIPVFGQWQLTKNCLLSLKVEVDVPFEVIVIDNGANALENDETRIEAPILGKKLFGDNFVYLPQEQNLNFAGGSNLGAKVARAPLLFFLNNDTIVQPNFLLPLLEAMENSNSMKVVAPVLEYPNNTIQHIGVFFTPDFKVGHLYEKFPINHRVVKRKRKLQCVTGAAFVMTKKDFLEVGLFNEDFKNGYEDVELCGRLKKYNAEFEVLPQTLITHYCSQSQGRYDNEKHNSSVLESSGNYNFTRDWHTLLENDGYQLRFADNLRFMPDLNAKLNNSFKPLIQENNFDKILAQYIKEPYWKDGFFALINHQNITKKMKFDLIVSSHYVGYSKETLFELFSIVNNEPHKKHYAKAIISYVSHASTDRKTVIKDTYEQVRSLSHVLANDCYEHINNINQYFEELSAWEKIVLPKIKPYL